MIVNGTEARPLAFGPTATPRGECMAVKVGGQPIALISDRTQALAALGPIARKMIYADAVRPVSRNCRRVPYTRVRRPILDEITMPGLRL